jgi:hypothetical protein
MKKAWLIPALASFLLAAFTLELDAQQMDLRALSRDLLTKSEARRAEANRLASGAGWPTSGYCQDGSYFELQSLIGGVPQFYVTFNRDAAHTTRTDSVQAIIGGGSGFTLREWDAGKPRVTHQELVGRVTWADSYDPGTTYHYHSTHVAGTLIASGVKPQAKGMSYQANLRAFDWDNDASEMASEAAAGMTLSNHSYGFGRGWTFSSPYWYWYGDTAVSEVEDYEFGIYDYYAQEFDLIANAAPNYLIVASAANDRDDAGPGPGGRHYYWDANYAAWRISYKTRNPDGGTAGYDCIPNGMQIAKNSLTIGAVNDVPNYTGPSDIVMTVFSSWGPTDDGRIKPDLVGNGYQLYSSYSTCDTCYAIGSGTSMSSPNVCGSLGLLQDYYMDHHGGTPMRAATLKGLVINTAREAGPNPGPDYMFGWGLLDDYGAYKLLNSDYLNDTEGLIEELTLLNGQTIDLKYRVYGAPALLKVTICWNDPAATPPAPSLNPRTRMLVNDLDLRVLKGASTYYPWRLDVYNPANAATQADNNIDNVEQVEINLPSAGLYTIRINHKGTLSGGSQAFSLIVSGAEKNHLWHVYADGSGDAPTIAAAVSSAVDGDTIYVHGGVYNEHDISVSKQLIIKGIADGGAPIVDAQSLGRCVTFPSSTKTILFNGFTLRNGASSGHGGGVYCENASVTISECVVRDNHATAGGGGISVVNFNPIIKKCTFFGNSATSTGGAIEAFYSNPVFDSCLVYDNTATLDGGGVVVTYGSPSFQHCTISHNSGVHGGGIYVGTDAFVNVANTIVSFSPAGAGIYGFSLAGATVTCCDVYGNAGGDYGGSISDRTGTNNNISEDPIFCDASTIDYAISSISPCAPAASPCGQLIGRLGVGCVKGPDLLISDVQWSDTQPAFGDSIAATVKIKNVGQLDATKSFYVDYYENLASPPAAGTPGDERHLVAGLAAGDSIVWVTAWAKATAFEEWTSYFRVDTGDSVLETNEANNLSGPHSIEWRIPTEAGWPVVIGHGFHSSPAIASLDADESTLEIIVGCDDGKLYVFRDDGTLATGWPVTIGDTLFSSPAVGDIVGDYHREVVIGGMDGKVYAYNYQGEKLWEYPTAGPIRTTPVLADLDGDGKSEVLCTSGESLYALEGDGSVFAGSWPYSAGAGTFTSPAVGDVDGDGTLDIAVIAYGYTAPVESDVFLLEPNGALFSGSWPVVVDTVIMADPVLGNVTAPASDLEIVAGAANGRVYVWKSDGTPWPASPRVVGTIEASPILAQLDGDDELEIVVSSREAVSAPPPDWEGLLTAIDDTGALLWSGAKSLGTWGTSPEPVPSPISIGSRVETMLGSPAQYVYSWDRLALSVYGFPLSPGGAVLASAAADDMDRDGTVELVVASGDSITCYELNAADYGAAELWWPMFRHDRARTGCYGAIVPTAVEGPGEATPAVTRIRSIHPNPFNPVATVSFDLGKRARVQLSVYDVSGRRVAVLIDREMEAGAHEAVWNGRASDGRIVASGVYFCKLKAGGIVETKKMVLLR